MPTILHISDLHRTADPHLTNDDLLSAITSDSRRWQAEGIPSPDVIVVSGDLIQGVGIDDVEAESKINAQYAEADEFLGKLADRLVESDLSRVVIVPGNHDVHWQRARQAMQELETCPPDIARLGFEADSAIRWDWKDQQAYKISDRSLYDSRLHDFRQFRANFYADVNPSPLSKDDSDVVFFDYPDLGIAVVGFASWYGNDCFCHVGEIAPSSLSRAQELLTTSRAPVAIAVWHHSIDGGPRANDFMDERIIHRLIDLGFSVGVHGHQHFPRAAPFTLDLPNQTAMSVVCAGSLAVGDGQLPMGERRQFNIVDIDPDRKTVTVHVREMSPAGVFSCSPRADFGGNTFIELRLPHAPARPDAPTPTQIIDDAISAVGLKEFEKALELVDPLPPSSSPEIQQIKIKSLTGLERWDDLIELLDPPGTADEAVMVIALLINQHRFVEARERLEGASKLLAPSTFDELAKTIEARRMLSDVG